MTHQLVRAALLIVLVTNCASAQVSAPGPIMDEGNTVSHFVDLEYPVAARSQNIQGAVIAEARLREDGRVASVVALSGPMLLIQPALDNVRQWQFAPNKQKRVIVVYDFRIEPGVCQDRSRSIFLLRRYNVASIVTCEGLAMR